MKYVYIAHPLGADPVKREENRRKAAEWVGYLAERFNIAPIADWIVLSGVWDESKRDLGLSIDKTLIYNCNEVWLCGERVSEGMGIEKAHAEMIGRLVVDLTGLDFDSAADVLRRLGVESR